MIKQVLKFRSDTKTIPSDEDLMKCLEIQKNSPDKIVELHWHFRWSGNYKISFENANTLEEVKEKMPKCYRV